MTAVAPDVKTGASLLKQSVNPYALTFERRHPRTYTTRGGGGNGERGWNQLGFVMKPGPV